MSVITWITGVESIKRQTRAAYGCMPKSVGAGLNWGLLCSVCGTHRRCSCSMRLLALYKCYAFTFLHVTFTFTVHNTGHSFSPTHTGRESLVVFLPAQWSKR